MAFDEFTRHRLEKAVGTFVEKRRPPAYMRKELDLGFRIKDQSIEVFEIRPRWQHPEEIIHSPVAKTTYVRTQDIWKIYWMRQDLKWHSYGPLPEVTIIEEFLAEVDSDPHHCFWG
jgi:hypothetical protein